MEFDNVAHERHIAERYERIARLAAFDAFVDLALDGAITMDEAIKGFTEEYIHPLADTATAPPHQN